MVDWLFWGLGSSLILGMFGINTFFYYDVSFSPVPRKIVNYKKIADNSCNIDDLVFAWPFKGKNGEDWAVKHYNDLDKAPRQKKDYWGNTKKFAKTYDGHRGVDISVPSLRYMDKGFKVYASAPGIVTGMQENHFDRQTKYLQNCSWNYVRIKHKNGYSSVYGHLKKGSVDKEIGDLVRKGEAIGVVGSSGCSTGAHLHFQVEDCKGRIIDPFLNNMWENPPPYQTLFDVMDLMVKSSPFRTREEVADPGPNELVIPDKRKFGIALAISGGKKGDFVQLVLEDIHGVEVYRKTAPLKKRNTQSYRVWEIDSGRIGAGHYLVKVFLNDELKRRYPIDIETESLFSNAASAESLVSPD